MSFTIVVHEKRTRVAEIREYKKVANSGNPRDSGVQYGYVTTQGNVTVESKVYEQTVEEMDIIAVIASVNGQVVKCESEIK